MSWPINAVEHYIVLAKQAVAFWAVLKTMLVTIILEQMSHTVRSSMEKIHQSIPWLPQKLDTVVRLIRGGAISLTTSARMKWQRKSWEGCTKLLGMVVRRRSGRVASKTIAVGSQWIHLSLPAAKKHSSCWLLACCATMIGILAVFQKRMDGTAVGLAITMCSCCCCGIASHGTYYKIVLLSAIYTYGQIGRLAREKLNMDMIPMFSYA